MLLYYAKTENVLCLYVVLIMFRKHSWWNLQRLVEHIKFQDFHVFDVALLYYAVGTMSESWMASENNTLLHF